MSTADFETILTRLHQVIKVWSDGGFNGSCYRCPYATPPLESSGREAVWADISNDPTEAYFRCSLPGRDNESVVWGEYAPCTADEWWDAHADMLRASVDRSSAGEET